MQEKLSDLQQITELLNNFKMIENITKIHPEKIKEESKLVVKDIEKFCKFNIQELESLYTRSIFNTLEHKEIEIYKKTIQHKIVALKDMIAKIKFEEIIKKNIKNQIE